MRRKAKPVKGWAVLCEDGLIAFGNGKQYQLPVFHNRAEARDWKRDQYLGPLRIVCVEIREIKK